MSLTIKNKLCFVPSCPSSSKRNPKKIFFSVPKCKYARAQWYKAVGRDHPICYDTFFVCEDHFDLANDIVKNDLVDKPTMKKSVVPHLKLNTIECIIDNLVEENAKILQDLDQLGTRKVSGKMDKQFEVCRTCLATTDLKSLYDVYMPERLDEMLMMCTSLECSINDGLPIKICTNCVYELRRSYKFALKCREIDAKLRDCYKQIANDTKSAQKCVIKKEINPELVLIKNTTNSNQETPISLKDPLEIYHEPYPDLDIVKHELNDVKQEIILDQTQEEDHIQVSNISKLQHPTQRPETDYQCNICHKIFITFSMLEEHLNEHPKPKSSRDVTHPCTVCGKLFKYNCKLEAHMHIHSVQKYVCKVCGKLFAHKQNLSDHLHAHVTQFSCTICDSTFRKERNLQRHMKALHEVYECEMCGRVFHEKKHLMEHVASHRTKQPTHTCAICAKVFPNESESNQHMLTHTVDKSYACTTCKRSFIDQSYLSEHKLTHSLLETHVCSICNIVFAKELYLTRHMLIHKQETIYSCTICERSFLTQVELTEHAHTHIGEIYSCSICYVSFAKKEYLNKHMHKHSNKAHYSCPICFKFYFFTTSLESHMLRHSETKSFLCLVCKETFCGITEFIQHMGKHPVDSRYQCTICNLFACRKQNVNL